MPYHKPDGDELPWFPETEEERQRAFYEQVRLWDELCGRSTDAESPEGYPAYVREQHDKAIARLNQDKH